ncbi:efflux RND transporter periplasmic adaptor subunit [Spirosoma taeanense]|uniref:Efflux RND transporter periplasmic adaptor subunit n=1 Tax=Spirosoma taeanense TaxID=2735870 RepID=A0A6M5Y9N4_9BACT|nr:efflux RND transporter periplasmic adaptor subunit [Spirosoma taeanense]QJW89923.1 efflux RND transporter periplasmic adaptor subunit [Spirosoma taeanense]
MNALKVLINIGLLGLLIACSTKPEPAQDDSKQEAFTLTDTMLSRIQTEEVKPEPIRSQLRLIGRVVPDENRVIRVFPLVGGNVRDVRAELGDYVQKGQTLAIIQSGEVAGYNSELTQAQAELRLAQKNLQVAQDMFADKLSSERDVLAARKEVEREQAELARLKEVLQIYGADQQSQSLVKAPISGYVLEKNINRGTQLRSDDANAVFTISQLNEIWVLANVNESDIGRIKTGLSAQIQTLSYPDRVFHGTVDKVYNVLDQSTKTMQIRVRLANEQMLLKPGMNASVTLSFEEGGTLPVIPAKALIFDKSKQFVMVFHDRKRIDTREVQVYRSQGDVAYIRSGLKPGERVITQSQLLIYDALND